MTATEALNITQVAAERIMMERGQQAAVAASRREQENRRSLEAAFTRIRDFAHAGSRSCPIELPHATHGYVRQALTDRGYVIDAYTRPDNRGFGFSTITVRW